MKQILIAIFLFSSITCLAQPNPSFEAGGKTYEFNKLVLKDSVYYKHYIDSILATISGASGVSSFNSRTGPVTPQSSDYSAFFKALSYVPDWSEITSKPTIPTNNNQLTNGSGFITSAVTSASVVSANGFAGSVATSTTTPAITLSTTVTGLLKGDGTAVSAATAGTDYLTPTGSAANLTSFPTFNQSTTGNAATATKLATARTINGVSFDGTANVKVSNDSAYVNLALLGSGAGLILIRDNKGRDTINFTTTVKSGSYTPTLTNSTNASASALNFAYYTQTGNIVHVIISGTVTPSSASTQTFLTVSLPLSSSTASGGFIGQGNFNSTVSGSVLAVSSTTATFIFTPPINTLSNFVLQLDYSL